MSVTVEDEEETEDTALTPAEELYRIGEARNEDGTVDVEVVDWEKEDGEARVDFTLPTGETASEYMEWPWPLADDPSEYKFVRIVEAAGYEIVSAEELRGSRARLTARYDEDDDMWRLEAPEQLTRSERFRRWLASPDLEDAGYVVLWTLGAPVWLLFIPLAITDPDEPGGHFEEENYNGLVAAFTLAVGTALWTTLALALLV